MNRDAIFSDGTRKFLDPPEPQKNTKVNIRIRIASGDATKVYLVTEDYHIPMAYEESHNGFDFYKVGILVGEETIRYCFNIQNDEESVYFARNGVSNEPNWYYALTVIPGFTVPEWTKGAVMYQILVDRFYNGDPDNDVTDYEYVYIGRPVMGVRGWDSMPETVDVGRFYGGDLEGVRQKLSYLRGMGIEGIYFNPLFVSPSNHKYDIQDYDYIDPHYGRIVKEAEGFVDSAAIHSPSPNAHADKYITRVTDKANLEASNKFFADFVNEAHAKGIRVVIDGVFNHCGSFNKWMDRERLYEHQKGYEPGAYISKNSPYHDFFSFEENAEWPYCSRYDGWWGYETLPKLNYEGSKRLEEYILNIGRKWVSEPYNCDGWRLDVAADLGHSPEYNHEFWAKFRKAVKEANPNAVILAEHYGDPSSWLEGDQWDTIMNYDAFMEPVTYFLTGMEKHSDAFDEAAIGNGARFKDTMIYNMARMSEPSIFCSLNQLSNHDHSRFLTRTNHKVGRVADLGSEAAGEDVNYAVMRQAIVMQMTWPGAPCLYYGDEVGVVGFTDPDSRRSFPWDNMDRRLQDFYRDAIFMRKTHYALKQGSIILLDCGDGYVSYGRSTPDVKMAVTVNTSDEALPVEINVWRAGFSKESTIQQILTTNEKGYSIMPIPREIRGGILKFEMKPHSAYVFTERINGADI